MRLHVSDICSGRHHLRTHSSASVKRLCSLRALPSSSANRTLVLYLLFPLPGTRFFRIVSLSVLFGCCFRPRVLKKHTTFSTEEMSTVGVSLLYPRHCSDPPFRGGPHHPCAGRHRRHRRHRLPADLLGGNIQPTNQTNYMFTIMYMCVYLYIYISLSLSIYLSLSLYIYIYISLSLSIYIYIYIGGRPPAAPGDLRRLLQEVRGDLGRKRGWGRTRLAPPFYYYHYYYYYYYYYYC